MKVLVAGWDSGGGVEVVQAVVRQTVARGHDVRVLGTEGLRPGFESAGAEFRRYRYAPDNDLRWPETDLVKDWEVRNPLRLWGRVRDRLLVGPAREFCRDVLEELRREAADVVVVDTMIPSAIQLTGNRPSFRHSFVHTYNSKPYASGTPNIFLITHLPQPRSTW